MARRLSLTVACMVLVALGLLLFFVAMAWLSQGTAQVDSGQLASLTCPVCTRVLSQVSGHVHEVTPILVPQQQKLSIPDAASGKWFAGFFPPLEVALFLAGLGAVLLGTVRVGGRIVRLRKSLPLIVVALLLVSPTSPLFLNVASVTASPLPASPIRTVTYQSDFTTVYPKSWYAGSSGSVQLATDGGKKVMSVAGTSSGGPSVIYLEGESWQNISLAATLKGVTGTFVGVDFRLQNTITSASHYTLYLNFGTRQVTLSRLVGTTQATTTSLANASYAVSSGAWYAVSVTANGGRIQASVNGSQVINIVDTQPLLFGTIGFEDPEKNGAFSVGSVAVTSQMSPQSTWQQLGGPDGGSIGSIDVNPVNPNVVYASAIHAGVFMSDNKGDFWKEIGYSNGMPGTKANIVVVAPSNAAIVWASAEDSSLGGGPARSDDGGAHWKTFFQSTVGVHFTSLAIDPRNANVVYTATDTSVGQSSGSNLPLGLTKSTDGGATWTSLLSATVQSIAVAPSNSNILYIGTSDQGVLRSDDAGATWRSIPLPATGAPVNRVVIDPQNPNIALAHVGGLSLAGRTQGQTFRTTNGGTSWTSIQLSSQTWPQIVDVAIAPSASQTLYAAAVDISGNGLAYRSDDSGSTWRLLTTTPFASMTQVVKVDPTDLNTVYVGTYNSGVYRTTDGGASWVKTDTGFLGGGIYALAVHPTNNNVIFASKSTNGPGEGFNNIGFLTKSVDGGISWTDSPGPPFNIVTILIDRANPNVMYVGTGGSTSAKGSGVYKSTDGGQTWAQKNQGLNYLNVSSMAISPSNSNIVFAGTGLRPYGGTAGGGIYKSADGGGTWRKVNIPNLSVPRILINPSNPNTMYAATMGGGVYKSTDAGENWSQVNAGLSSTYIYVLGIDPSSPDTLYSGGNGFYGNPGVFNPSNDVAKTTDGGASWRTVLVDQDFEWLVLDPADSRSVYVGTHAGQIFWTRDGGSTWVFGGDGQKKIGGHMYMWAAVADPIGRAMLIGSCGRGVFINHLAASDYTTPTWLKIHYGSSTYNAILTSNSSLSDFSFNPASKSLAFAATGSAGTRALTNVTIPTNLLMGPYVVTLDGNRLTPLSTTTVASKNVTSTVVSYIQNGGVQQLSVQGASVVTTTTTTSTTTASTSTSSTTSSTTTTTTAIPEFADLLLPIALSAVLLFSIGARYRLRRLR